MNENTAPIVARRVVLLVKSQKFAGQAGYFLQGGRWHAIKHDKPAPKGAPKAKHPGAAGQHAPVVLTDEQVEQLKYPAEKAATNKEMAAHNNVHLPKLLEHAANGDATAILGTGFGTNSHSKKKALAANVLLGMMGSSHKVELGQAAGSHPAVQVPAAHEPAEAPAKPAEKPKLGPVGQALKEAIKEPAAQSATPGLAMPAFVEGKTTNSVVSYYEGQAQKILDMAAAGDAVGLAAMKEAGLKQNAKGKVSNTFAGKTQNSKLLLALHGQALEQANGGKPAPEAEKPAEPKPEPKAEKPAPAPASPEQAAEPQAATSKLSQIPWDSLVLPDRNTNAKSHNGKVAQIKAMAEAGDLAGLEAFTAGKNTYGTKQKKLAALAAAALKEDAAAPAPIEQAKPAEQPAPEPAATEPAEQGPKEGDTKPAADGGTLVFSKGRWHKQEQPKAAEPAPPAEPEPAAAVPAGKKLKPSEAIAIGKGLKTASGMKAKLKALAVAGDVAGLQEFISVANGLPASKKYAEKLITAMTDGEPGAAAPPKAAPKPATAGGIESMDAWTQTGPQGGSNPGGKFKDQDGVEWYCKFPGNEDVAKSEVLAAKLYGAAGVSGQDAKLVMKDGKLGIASRWHDVSKVSPAALAKADGVAAGFAADAWLGNWDVVGLGYDNLQLDATGKAMRIDAGGSLEYRAQGGKKAFGNVVTEIDSLRDPKINPQSAAVFGKMTKADITAGVAKVLKVSDAQIHALVNTYGPGDAAHKKALAETLIARKADLLAKFPKAKKAKKHTFKPEKISEPPSFLNWGGSGKDGPSSKPFVNQANEKAVQAIYEAAKTGSIDAVKELTAETYDKATGEVTGSAKVLEHPSQHVKGYAQQAINEINYQLNPPKRFRFEGGHPLSSLNSAYPSHKGPPHSDAVEKAGKFLVLGEPGTVSLDALALPKITHASGQLTKATYSPAAQSAIQGMPETQKQAIKAYTGSSYVGMNSSLWTGNPTGAAKAAGEALHTMGHDIAPGTVLSRKLSVQGAALDQILKSTGKVLQEPAIMSTSIRPSSWSGNVQLKLHVGPGVKGLWVGPGSAGGSKALSMNAGEDELILPPNTRLLILSVKKPSGPDADGFGAGAQHVIEAVILPSMQAS
ncbi:hypothetical protein K32_48920 [Kaistia sp. 32K]|uniref:hypothetical protein n=1 Tax=Kaistia sp. 32K TaxID=2795690 RepID=UPI001916C689|nr:hypothetical protein [Kaistia sp. 32K]BCP56275.1 hypothetical protein K32_48920 [Kaistia sp. 32K]